MANDQSHEKVKYGMFLNWNNKLFQEDHIGFKYYEVGKLCLL